MYRLGVALLVIAALILLGGMASDLRGNAVNLVATLVIATIVGAAGLILGALDRHRPQLPASAALREPDDPLAAARGIGLAALLGGAIWLAVLAAIARVVR
jgi:hypothetical protein